MDYATNSVDEITYTYWNIVKSVKQENKRNNPSASLFNHRCELQTAPFIMDQCLFM